MGTPRAKKTASILPFPTPQSQVDVVEYALHALNDPPIHGPRPTRLSAAMLYNGFADVPAYELPHADEPFADETEARRALGRLRRRLLTMFEGQVQSHYYEAPKKASA